MFIHLHCHSHYSFLRAVPSPQDLVDAAVAAHAPAVALTDTNGLYGAVPFYQAARAAGIKPIVGTLLDVEIDFRFLLLAENAAGYSNLCRLLTLRHLEDRPVRLEELAAHRKGLIALYAPSCRGTTCRAPTTEGQHIASLRDIFPAALYLEAWHFSGAATPVADPEGRRACSEERSGCVTSNLRESLRLSKLFSLPLVATNNVHFLRPEEFLHHRVLNAIRTGALVSQMAPPEISSLGAYFKSGSEMRWAFADYPEALAATVEIAERSNLELSLGRTIFPEFSVPDGETPFSYLWKLCFEGARRRYQPLRPEVLARLTHELEVIDRLKLAPYFLLVWEIAEEARRRGIPAVARGSAASSIVTYCLGISRVCPLRWGLYF
ncbi:MAG TPA: PHP domain-containing protein, partial [Candidatus Acidoferrales bacterium]|nr:PHP domain-containing protein [Candidatus Acidoferrales bacterium]